jgi:predicted MFS family arabinose efflux permease
MVVGGGVLLSSFDALGWLPTMLVMAGLIVLMSLPLLLYREPLPVPSSSSSSSLPQVSWLSWLHYFTRNNGAALTWAAALIAYKFGDALGSPMTQTLLVDRGYGVDDIGRIAGIYGSVAGMAGAMLGGVVARRSRLGALLVCGLVHAALMLAYAWPAAVPDLDHTVTTVLFVVEHLTGGMATVALFTVMMDATRKSSGASDYTAQASIVVVASGIGSSLSGVLADAVGYEAHFIVAGVLCVIGTLVMVPVFRRGLVPDSNDNNNDDDSTAERA